MGKRKEEARVGVKKQNSENSGESLLFKGWKITLAQGHQPNGRALALPNRITKGQKIGDHNCKTKLHARTRSTLGTRALGPMKSAGRAPIH